jgi:thiol-disulfide isomerase/thioredoxin
MNRLLLLLFLTSFAITTSSFSNKEFTVTVTLPKDMSVTKVYLDRMVDDKHVRDSAAIENGQVILKNKIEHPVKGRLVFFLPSIEGQKPEVKFVEVILEPGNIKVDASAGVNAVVYTGSKTQDEFTTYKSAIAPILKSVSEKWGEVYKAGQDNDKEKENKLKDEAKKLGEKVKNENESFMEKNSQSLVTALILKDYVTPVWENLDKAQLYYSRLNSELKKNPEVVKFANDLAVAQSLAIGKNYPDFSLPDSTGKMISVSSMKGKYVFVDFWASWCGPCRNESPALVAAYKKYNNKGFEILSVSFDENAKAWLKAVAKDGYTWANVVDTSGMGPKGKLATTLKIKAIPRNFLLDKEGKVIATNLRGEALENKLKDVFGS